MFHVGWVLCESLWRPLKSESVKVCACIVCLVDAVIDLPLTLYVGGCQSVGGSVSPSCWPLCWLQGGLLCNCEKSHCDIQDYFLLFFCSFSTSVVLCKALLHKLPLSAAILIQLFTDFQLVSIYYIMIIVIVMNKDLVFLIPQN